MTTPNLFWVITALIEIDIESRNWRVVCVKTSREEADAVMRTLEAQRSAFEARRSALDVDLNQQMSALAARSRTENWSRDRWFAAAEPLHADEKAKKEALLTELDMLDRHYEWEVGTVSYSLVETSDDPRHVPAASVTEGTP